MAVDGKHGGGRAVGVLGVNQEMGCDIVGLQETRRSGQSALQAGYVFLKKNQNAPRPSEHPPVMGKKCQNVKVGSKAANTKPLHGI